mgnify:CR=1 FL=1
MTDAEVVNGFDEYVRNLTWSVGTSEEAKTLVIGNLRNFWATFCRPREQATHKALNILTETCAAMADPEHCLHHETKSMSREQWTRLREHGRKALRRTMP